MDLNAQIMTNISTQELNDTNYLFSTSSDIQMTGFLDTNLNSLWMRNYFHSFIVSMSVIIISELGDKTFFITAIMAMKNSRLVVFLTSSFALLLMTILSVCMGVAVTVIPKLYTQLASAILFFCFGIKMLMDVYAMNEDGSSINSEYAEASKEIEERVKAADVNNNSIIEKEKGSTLVGQQVEDSKKHNGVGNEHFCESSEAIDVESKKNEPNSKVSRCESLFSGMCSWLRIAPVVLNVFTMIFVAEWGDRSQLSTIILAAKEDVTGVFFGSFFGHVLCNGLAVIGGRFFAEIISVRTSEYSEEHLY